MATPRLPFLYPNLFRTVRSCKPTTYQSIKNVPTPKRVRQANFHTKSRHAQETYQQRYGPAVSQSLPPPPKPSEPLTSSQNQDVKAEKDQPSNKDNEHIDVQQGEQTHGESKEVKEDASSQEQEPRPEKQGQLENKELDIVLSVPSPSEIKGQQQRHPHLEASPYEHHFDTYSLVQQLIKEIYTEEQAVTLMKAIRLMLAVNLDVAKESLVSKSDTENEIYLFRAACSELRTTLESTRHSETLTQRTHRAQLQHEYDILNQKVTQELMTAREELKGMFNDRKMGLEEEKRRIDGKISDINYEITVMLNSELKSEVEGLRWVLTRRAALAIAVAAFMIISTLNYSSIKLREKEEAEKKRAAARKAQEQRAEARYTTPSRAQGTQTDSSTSTGTSTQSYEESLG